MELGYIPQAIGGNWKLMWRTGLLNHVPASAYAQSCYHLSSFINLVFVVLIFQTRLCHPDMVSCQQCLIWLNKFSHASICNSVWIHQKWSIPSRLNKSTFLKLKSPSDTSDQLLYLLGGAWPQSQYSIRTSRCLWTDKLGYLMAYKPYRLLNEMKRYFKDKCEMFELVTYSHLVF